jgi:hypothetical protein
MQKVQMVLNELMGFTLFVMALGFFFSGKHFGVADVMAGPTIGGLLVAMGLCYVAAAIDRQGLARAPAAATTAQPSDAEQVRA